ncbi:MAG: tripartite tricarboxylate transporter TctB family protein [Rhodospirillales bacterium]|nr:tripartite tricarboxylate transporter TctB family protein [Rhodospirillales bacterium]
MYDRILGFVLVGVSVVYGWSAYQFEVPFQYEPLGPKAFPLILAALMVMSGIGLIFRPDRLAPFPDRKGLANLALACVIMFFYAATFRWFGFILATVLAGSLIGWLFGAKPVRAVAYAVVLAVVGYFVCGDLLRLNVPAGALFG